MKRAIILLLVVATIGSEAFAQKGFHAGFKFAPQSVWMFNNRDSDAANFRFQSTIRFMFGGTLNYHFNDQLGFGIDLLLSQMGQDHTLFEGGPTVTHEVNYFKLPILFHFNGSPENTAMFQGYFGPSINFNTSDDGVYNALHSEDPATTTTDPITYGTHVSLVLGLGVGFNFNEYLGGHLGLRLDGGISDARQYPDGYSGNIKTTNAVSGGIEIGITARIPVK